MPVIVIGADTPIGSEIVDALIPRSGEVRAFVSDPETAARLRERGLKVALGDVSDGSHVGWAAMRAFSAVLVWEAASDERERAFAGSPPQVARAWVDGLEEAGVTRAIWVSDPSSVAEFAGATAEVEVIDPRGRRPREVANEVRLADDRPA